MFCVMSIFYCVGLMFGFCVGILLYHDYVWYWLNWLNVLVDGHTLGGGVGGVGCVSELATFVALRWGGYSNLRVGL